MDNKNTRKDRKPVEPLTTSQRERLERMQVSRRAFLRKSGGVAVATVGTGATGTALAGSAIVQEEGPEAGASPFEYEFEGVPDTPAEPPPDSFEALTEEEAAVVEALTARIMPGTPDDPGARKAGVVHYIDGLLAYNSGLHEATYTRAPWARPYEGDAPPEDDDEQTIWVHADEIGRYGYQAPLSPLQVYQIAIEAIEQHAQDSFGSGISDLREADQDQIIWDLLDENIDGFDQFSPRAFFHTLRRHTSEGMFSDPAYGGNRDLVGWKLVGFPGSQRAYSPEELVTEDEPRPPQAMSHLPVFNPGEQSHDDHDNVLQPVREEPKEQDD